MLDTNILVKTDQFDGPLGLLLHLIQKEEMDIKKLDLTHITRQYLDFLAKMRELNFDVAGDYLYLAATLVLLKSKTCITEEESFKILQGDDEIVITSQAELIRRLEELQHYQEMGQKLWSLDKLGHEVFIKPKIDRKTIVNSILSPMDLEKLTTTMMDLIQKNMRKFTVVKRDRLSIKEKLQFLKNFLRKGEQRTFNDVLSDGEANDITNIIISFISILELARLKKVSIFQNDDQGEIYIDVKESLEDFDVNMADGFEEDEESEESEESEVQIIGEEIKQTQTV